MALSHCHGTMILLRYNQTATASSHFHGTINPRHYHIAKFLPYFLPSISFRPSLLPSFLLFFFWHWYILIFLLYQRLLSIFFLTKIVHSTITRSQLLNTLSEYFCTNFKGTLMFCISDWQITKVLALYNYKALDRSELDLVKVQLFTLVCYKALYICELDLVVLSFYQSALSEFHI